MPCHPPWAGRRTPNNIAIKQIKQAVLAKAANAREGARQNSEGVICEKIETITAGVANGSKERGQGLGVDRIFETASISERDATWRLLAS